MTQQEVSARSEEPTHGLAELLSQDLQSQIDELRAAVARVEEAQRHARTVTDLIPRDILEPGRRLRNEWRAASYRLRDARREYLETEAQLGRAHAELSHGGPFRDGTIVRGRDRIEAHRDHLLTVRDQHRAAVAAAEEALRQAEEALYPYVGIRATGVDLTPPEGCA